MSAQADHAAKPIEVYAESAPSPLIWLPARNHHLARVAPKEKVAQWWKIPQSPVNSNPSGPDIPSTAFRREDDV